MERRFRAMQKQHALETDAIVKAVEAKAALEFAALPSLIQNLMIAHKSGQLLKHHATAELLEGISTCLRNGSTRGRRLNDTEKAFYGMLLNSTSPWAHKFVSQNLFGPDLRTSQKERAGFHAKLDGLGLSHESLVRLHTLLSEYGLHLVPGIVSEDATTALRRIDFELMEKTTAQSQWDAGIRLWGFSGGLVVVHSIEELRAQFKVLPLAAYVYVYTWVPLLPNAPWFPFAVIATDNKFNANWVWAQWRLIWKSCKELALLVAGMVSDGDSRLRKTDFRTNFGTNSLEDPSGWCVKVYAADLHALLYLTLPETSEGYILFAHQDYMHLAWRLRVQFLSGKKIWQIGMGLTTAIAHLTDLRDAKGDVLLNGKDLDPHNKQHWPGVVKMFSPAVAAALKARIDGPDKEAHLTGTYIMVVVFEKYLGSWLKDREEGRSPLDAIRDAACVLSFMLHWRYYVNQHHSLSNNFLTRETCLDMITSCHGCILRFWQFRECWGGKFRPDGPRFSSAYSEYVFQHGRMAQTNSPVVAVKGWVTHIEHYNYQQHLEAKDLGLKLPMSCRGIPHTIEAVDIQKITVPRSWHPTDDGIRAAIDRGVADTIALLGMAGIDPNLGMRNGFFLHPWKHFPLKDRTYAVDMDEDGEKEDDPTEARPDGEAVDQTVVAAQDAADADAVLGQLMRTALPTAQQAVGNDDSQAVLEEVSKLLASFNQTIQEEAKDRKYRFHVKRLLKAHLRAGDDVDPELDFITDDDDLAVLFTLADGRKIWAIGNVEEVAVVRGAVDKNRALGSRAAEYLLGLEKDARPIKGAHIDDDKAVFLLRYYQEAKADGTVLRNQYQHKDCKAFYLPLDNGGYAFEWVSNNQVLTPVHLAPSPSINRLYTLPGGDKKTVQSEFRKHKA